MSENLFEHNVSSSAYSTGQLGLMRKSEIYNMSDYDLWYVAMTKKMDSFKQHQVLDIVERGMTKQLRSKWVHGLKDTSVGELHQVKFIICGNFQIKHVDYYVTFAPTLTKDSLRLLLCVVVSRRLVLHQLNVQSVFLHGLFDHEVFVEFLLFVFRREIRSAKVKKLRRLVYRLCNRGYFGINFSQRVKE
jgi:Reverse transcriptase (RNA-dependent DNA polymerase)